VTYDARFRPPQPATPAPGEFTIHRSVVRDGLALAYVREGTGGYPLVLLHGYPETKRIWWRNIAPLAAAGFEVIVPDLRGYGDSDLSSDDVYDLAVYSRDVHALVHDVLGHERCAVAGGDIGGVVAVDLVHRFDGLVERLCFFNTVPPAALEQYAAAGMDYGSLSALQDGPTGDYRDLKL
jgi:pimeloyl-ACP methyl ester carboxylesterase